MTDYFEEKVVNHVLSWRMKPDGVWNPYSAEVLTSKLVEASVAMQSWMVEAGVIDEIFYDNNEEPVCHGDGINKHYTGDVDVQYFGVDYSQTLKDDKNGA